MVGWKKPTWVFWNTFLLVFLVFSILCPASESQAGIYPLWNYVHVESGVSEHILNFRNSSSSPISIANPSLSSYSSDIPGEIELIDWTTTIPAQSDGQVRVRINTGQSRVFKGSFQFTYNGMEFFSWYYLGVIVTGDGETEILALEAEAAEQWAAEQNNAANRARANNHGVLKTYFDYFGHDLYSDLGQTFEWAFERNNDFGVVAMNLAVSYSIPRLLKYGDYNEKAGVLLDWALEILGETTDQSSLAPMIYYNQARRRYLSSEDLTQALVEINLTLDHPLTSARLHLKSRFLRGAIHQALEERNLAYDDFSYLIDVDPGGPYGKMAQDAVLAWDQVRFSASAFQSPAASTNMDIVVVPIEGGTHWGVAYLTPADTTQIEFEEITTGVMHSRLDLIPEENCQLYLAFRAASGRDTVLIKRLSSALITSDEGGIFSLGAHNLKIPPGAISGEELFTLSTPLAPDSGFDVSKNIELSLELGPLGLALNRPASLELSLRPPPSGHAYYLVPHAQEISAGSEMEYDSSRGVALAKTSSLESYDVRLAALDVSRPLAEVKLVSRPNPVRDSTVIELSLAASGPATIAIFDLAGRRVKQVASGFHHAGIHRYSWDGCDERGAKLASGLYFCRYETGAQKGTTNIMMVR